MMEHVAGDTWLDDARIVRRAVAALAQSADARALGIMPAEAFALRAVAAEAQLEAFLRQGKVPARPDESLSALAALADTLR
jgi:hypothetical protein